MRCHNPAWNPMRHTHVLYLIPSQRMEGRAAGSWGEEEGSNKVAPHREADRVMSKVTVTLGKPVHTPHLQPC